jgi:hypothetical protein
MASVDAIRSKKKAKTKAPAFKILEHGPPRTCLLVRLCHPPACHRLRVVNFEVMPLSIRMIGGKNVLPTNASKNSAGTQARIAADSREYPRKPTRYSPTAEMRRVAQVRARI